MDTISIAAAAVTGARHLRAARNGQDAVATWQGTGGAVVVVADGCGSGACSEVGARLGAQLFARALSVRLASGEVVSDPAFWQLARAEVTAAITRLAGDQLELIHDYFLFTLIAGVVTREGAHIWALGDGAYSFGDFTRVLGPYADNQPPYIAYDLLGEPREAHVESAEASTVIIATDGACDLASGLERFATDKLIDHPDALRRQLAILARSSERVDWDARRIVRTPALLQDDCAVAIARRRS